MVFLNIVFGLNHLNIEHATVGLSDDDMDELIRSLPLLTYGHVDDARDNFAGFVSQEDTIQWIFQVPAERII